MGHKELNCTEESSKGSIKMNRRGQFRSWEYSLMFSFHQVEEIGEESFLRQVSPSRPPNIVQSPSVDVRPIKSLKIEKPIDCRVWEGPGSVALMKR
jgi:hypothetical protein